MIGSLHGVLWQQIPHHPIQRTAGILGCSASQVYNRLNDGQLKGITLGGRTLVTTESILALLAEAKPWVPDQERVHQAIRARAGARKPSRRTVADLGEPTTVANADQIRHGVRSPSASGRPLHEPSKEVV
jgi:hypothetical protein